MFNFPVGGALTALAITLLGSLPTAANATLISVGEALSPSLAAITTVATDGGTGFVQTSGSMGSFTLTSATATGSPLLPQPVLNTSSIDVSSSSNGTLYLYITQQGLTSPQGISSFLSSFTFNLFSGGGIASVTEKTFVSAANALYTGTLLSSVTDSSGGLASSAFNVNSPLLSGPFSETVEYAITATGAGSTNDTINLSSKSASVPVPEPTTLALLGAALALFTVVFRRRSIA